MTAAMLRPLQGVRPLRRPIWRSLIWSRLMKMFHSRAKNWLIPHLMILPLFASSTLPGLTHWMLLRPANGVDIRQENRRQVVPSGPAQGRRLWTPESTPDLERTIARLMHEGDV